MTLRPYRKIRDLELRLKCEVEERRNWEALAKVARKSAASFEAKLAEDPNHPGAELLNLRAENRRLTTLISFTEGFAVELKNWTREQRSSLDKLDALATDPTRKNRTA